ALLAAFWAIGGGWHHHRWVDRLRDDLAWSFTETPRPAWVRGVIRETMGLRQTDRFRAGPGFGLETAGPVQLTTRFILDLTAMSDGKRWHPGSGRTIVIVAGD